MSLSGKSLVYGILGDPIAHSLSPLMQNYALQQQGIDAVYVPFLVRPSALPSAVEGLRALGVSGFNVTIPHKESIIPLLDHIDPSAQLIGAVNTVVNCRGLLTGYNTDSSGFFRALKQDLKFKPVGSNVIIWGAGGASRAAVVALASAKVKSICVVNRTSGRVKKLVNEITPHFNSVQFSAITFCDSSYLDALSGVDLVVNTTPIGLIEEDVNILPLENIKGSASIYDMVYSNIDTPLVKAARSLDLACVDGLGMLAAQGEDAFLHWTGIRLPAGFMYDFLLKSIK